MLGGIVSLTFELYRNTSHMVEILAFIVCQDVVLLVTQLGLSKKQNFESYYKPYLIPCLSINVIIPNIVFQFLIYSAQRLLLQFESNTESTTTKLQCQTTSTKIIVFCTIGSLQLASHRISKCSDFLVAQYLSICKRIINERSRTLSGN